MKTRAGPAIVGVAVSANICLGACTTNNGGRGSLPATCPGEPDGGGLRAFTPPDRSTLGPGQILLTASGEALAEQGYNFPDVPANGVFADGWQVRFQYLIATFDRVTVSQNPDKVPTDQSQTDEAVAQACGPWAIDLAKATANDVPGKEQGETATPFAVLANQNLLSGSPGFATDGTKYAVGFSAIVASPVAINVNLDAEGQALYQQMIAKGCSVLYVGTATFKAAPDSCTTQDPEFSRFPPVVNFSFCFKSPTDYINCDNQDIMGTPFGSEPHPRGVVFPTNTYVTGEVTFHTDHPFWESVIHDTPAHFDQFAARVALPGAPAAEGGVAEAGTPEGGAGDGSGSISADATVAEAGPMDGDAASVSADGGVPTVTLDDVVGVDYLKYTDQFGNPVQWRSCVRDSTGMQYGKSSGRMSFDPQSVPKAPLGPSPTTAGLRDYYDYTTYDQSTQGHWNGSDGLCFVKRRYPSPP